MYAALWEYLLEGVEALRPPLNGRHAVYGTARHSGADGTALLQVARGALQVAGRLLRVKIPPFRRLIQNLSSEIHKQASQNCFCFAH